MLIITYFSPKLSLFCSAVVLCLFLCAGTLKMKSCVGTEKQALLKLKDGFIDDSHILSSWKAEVDCCQWQGVSCNDLTGHVTKLNIEVDYLDGLEGNIDSSLCELRYLTHLNLSYNYFFGKEIPKCIGSLGQLTELILSTAFLVGIIPHELQNLSNLQTLELGRNEGLVANNLEWISHLSSLRYLDLSGVNLSLAIDWQTSLSRKATFQLKKLILADAALVGTIPRELGNQSNLQALDLSGNDNLIANDLEWVSHVSSLRYLDLSSVNLSGAIDFHSSLSSILPSLLELHLDGCSLPQVISKSFFHRNSSTSLKVLSLASNDLDSSVFSWVSNISKVLQHLDLQGNSLQHIAPDAFTNTTSLKYLFLQNNELDSSMVNSISNLCQLKELDLSSNKLSSPLSEWIPQLGCVQNSVVWLYLKDNPFDSGPFPDISRFSYLKSLDLENMNLFGFIPQFFGHLSHLSYLDLSHNNLSGELPTFVGLSSLVSLYLSSNKLKGVINETSLSTLSSLQVLDVSHNSISFDFSSNWVPSFQLRDLYASSCVVGPNFPLWLKYQIELERLEFSNAEISSSVPQWLWLSPRLRYLNLSHNKIHGEIPKNVELNILDLSFNNFSGPISYFPSIAKSLDLSNNMFSGSISSICTTETSESYLYYLDLSNNLISGSLPNCWGRYQQLQILNLASNNFSGRIPNSIGDLESIESIHLNKNNFFGEIPNLKNLSYLKLIDFGQNHLNGNLPTWIGHNLPLLIVLRLKENKFQGSIPISICKLQLLQILDISQNNITGTIPDCLSNSSVLSNVTFSRHTIIYSLGGTGQYNRLYIPPFIDNAMLAWEGNDIVYNKNLGLMATIDLSCNQLEGEIPNSIVTLVALISLNLSRNNLTGFIPNNMGNMKMLESLDLSSNFLSGEIPTSFSALSFLGYLNLSFNNLSGEIPQTTQLQTFDASRYEGNQGLCGPPLPQCSTLDHPLPRDFTQDKEDKLISFGFYVSLILGFIIGFWGVCGSLIVKRSWRQAYFQFFSDIND